MELILWRHADAEDGIGMADAERALTRKGRRQAERMAAWLRERLDGDWRILVSPARRALETVDPLAMSFEVTELVGTGADSRRVIEAAGWPRGERVMVVGHQPTLGHVAGTLLGGEGDVAFGKGAVWWFATRERNGRTETVLKVKIDPEMLDAG